MKIVVTGGAGFIGSNLVHYLAGKGYDQIEVIDSLDYGMVDHIKNIQGVRLRKHRISQSSSEFLAEVMNGADVVFHLAAQKLHQNSGNALDLMDSNLQGTLALLEAALQAGVKKFIFSSSLYAHGRMHPPELSENDIANPETIYGLSKLASEHLCRIYSKKGSMSCIALRFFFVYGPRQFTGLGYPSVIYKNFVRMHQGQAPLICGNGMQSLDYIYIDDVLKGLLLAMQHDAQFELFNIGSGRSISINDLTQIMLDVAGKNLKPEFIAADFTDGTNRVADIAKAQSILNFTASTPITDGLKLYYEWLKKEVL